MNTTIVVVVIIIAAVVVAVVVGQTIYQRKGLRRRFGPEYDRTLENSGNRRTAERDLRDRQHRIDRMDIQPLDEPTRRHYRAAWVQVQERFVDDPDEAIIGADVLVQKVMSDRGYPTDGYEQQVADLSVDHARVLEHYRAAHDVVTRADDKATSTEELRQAVMHYRALFEDLLSTEKGDERTSTERRAEQ